MTAGDDQGLSNGGHTRGRKSVPWRRDLVILARLPEVERRHFAGQPNTMIAQALGVDEITIRRDLDRLRELWAERIADTQEALRAAKLAELVDVKHRAIRAAEWDEFCERAVLFDDKDLADVDLKRLGLDPSLRVSRDEKGSATFRGQKAASLNVARQAVMDQAKILGLVIDKQELTGRDNKPIPISLVEVIAPDGRGESDTPTD